MSDLRSKYEEKRMLRRQAAEEAYDALLNAGRVQVGDFTQALTGEFGEGFAPKYGRIIMDNDLWEHVIRMSLSEDDKTAFRSSWALEWAYWRGKPQFLKHTALFLQCYLDSVNRSVHRVFTKMLCDMIRCGSIELSEEDAEAVVAKCFDMLISDEVKVAVKVWAAEVLFEMRPRFDWIGESLEETVCRQMELNPSAAMLNHGRKLLGRLRKR